MNWRLWVGHWMLAKSRKHTLKAASWKERSERIFLHLRLRKPPEHNDGG